MTTAVSIYREPDRGTLPWFFRKIAARRQKFFPWWRLPPELRVKVLQNLDQIDLDNCRLLNRETFQLIRRNEKHMKRRIIYTIEAKARLGRGLLLYVHSYDLWNVRHFEEEVPHADMDGSHYFEPNVRLFDAIPWCLSKILDHAEVHHLLMTEYPVTEDLLVSISSRLPPGCQIHTLEIKDTRMDDVTSSTLLRFLRNVNPNKVVLKNIRGCSRELISLEVLQFIMSKPCFCVAYLSDSDWHSIPIPMGDDILRQLAAIDFEIGAPNMITLDGLKSYFAGLGRNEEIQGIIHTSFPLDGISFSVSPDAQLWIRTHSDFIKFSFQPNKA